MTTEMSIKDRLRQAKPITKQVKVWLGVDMNLLDEYRTAVSKLENFQPDNDSLAGGNRAQMVARVDELRAQMDEYAFPMRLRALNEDEYQSLAEQHPPRMVGDKVDPRDAESETNTTTFPAALLRAGTVEPELDDEDWARMFGTDGHPGLLSGAQVDELGLEVYRLTRVPVNVPFSSAGSAGPRNSSSG